MAPQFGAESTGDGWRNRDDRRRTDSFAGCEVRFAAARLVVATIDAARGRQVIAGMDDRLSRQRPQDQQKGGQKK